MREVLMKKFTPALLLLLLLFITQIPAPVSPQTRERTVAPSRSERNIKGDVVKVDVDLVTVDALVLKKNTARVVGDLKQGDFVISEDGTKQSISHFSQDSLPLSVLLLIDRGGCLDPFGSQVRRAAFDAISRLKLADEVAVMTYHNSAELLRGFTRDRAAIEAALNQVPPHDEQANHCLNKAFSAAADYMERAANPSGRRVVIAITGVTKNFDCPGGPSAKTVTHAVLESGSMVCGLIP